MNDLLHLPTLLVLFAATILMAGILLIRASIRKPASPVVKVLIAAALTGSAGSLIHGMRGSLPLWFETSVGLTLVNLGAGLFWLGVVLFHGRRAHFLYAILGAILWFAYSLVPAVHASVVLRSIAVSLVLGTYATLSGWEIKRAAAGEPLPSRMIVASVNIARGLGWFMIIPLTFLLGPSYLPDGSHAGWFALLTLCMTLVGIVCLVGLLVLYKERDGRIFELASERDSLTNIRNRRSFVKRAQDLLSDTACQECLLLLDIDDFKTINDTHGHAAGDQVLIAVARLLQSKLSPQWNFARIGGEEFACLIPGQSLEHALATAEALRQSIEEMVTPFQGKALKVTTSIGIARRSNVDQGLDDLLAAADRGLYAAKDAGRNCVRLAPVVTVFSSDNGAMPSRQIASASA